MVSVCVTPLKDDEYCKPSNIVFCISEPEIEGTWIQYGLNVPARIVEVWRKKERNKQPVEKEMIENNMKELLRKTEVNEGTKAYWPPVDNWFNNQSKKESTWKRIHLETNASMKRNWN